MISWLTSFIHRSRKQREMGRKGLVGSRRRLTPEDTLAGAAEHSPVLALIMLTLIWVVCVSILVFHKDEPREISLVLNQHAPNTEFSELPVFEYEDEEATEKLRLDAMAGVPLFYNISAYRINSTLALADRFFALLEQRGKPQPDLSVQGAEKTSVSELMNRISAAGIAALAHLIEQPEQKNKYLAALTAQLEQGIMSQREKDSLKLGQQIRLIDVKGRIRNPKLLVEIATPNRAAEAVSEDILRYYSNADREDFRKALNLLSQELIGAAGDVEYNKTVTDKERADVAKKITSVIVRYKQDQPLIRKNELVTSHTLSVLTQYRKALKESKPHVDFWKNFGRIAVFCLVLMIVTGIYISHIHPEVVLSNQKIWITGSVIIVSVFINHSAWNLFQFLSPLLNISPYWCRDVLPLALPSVLLSVTIGLRVAVYAGFFTAVIAAMMVGGSFDMVLKGMLVSCLAGFAVRYTANYKSFFAGAAGAVLIGFPLLDNQLFSNFTLTGQTLIYAAINGLITAICALLLLFLIEFIFNASTNMTLLALTDYNHPLLKRLQLEAPGTFHHSLMVATLAEQAAMTIHANPVKARVCSLYHDIGKLVKPEYFTENGGASDKHRELHPRMSSLIILNHVKEGVDLAIKYKLKKVVRDAIEQHHGTDLVIYFYKMAVEESAADNTPVTEEEYRYDGPLPHEKEIVLVSLADACEAASRSLQKPSPNKIETLVWDIIRRRVRDGQLDDADITVRELALVRDSFAKTLTTMLHGRIAYPKDEDDDENDLFMAVAKSAAAEPPAAKEDDK